VKASCKFRKTPEGPLRDRSSKGSAGISDGKFLQKKARIEGELEKSIDAEPGERED